MRQRPATRKPGSKSATKLGSIRHKNKRANIPTEELRDFVADEDLKSMFHPRDQSLDPQLVWKGKDERDREDLAVPVVPIYIQEKIHPQAIISGLPRIEKSDNDQPNLFADFNGGPNGTYLRLDVVPGEHILDHKHEYLFGSDPQTVRVTAGETVYFQYVGAASLVFEVADNQAQAARTVSKMRSVAEALAHSRH